MLASMSYYPGGKAGDGVFQRIINLMPPHQVYIEPFFGGGAIMRLKRPARVNIGIDRDRTALKMASLPAPAPIAQFTGRRSGSAFRATADPGGGNGEGPRGASFFLLEGDGIGFLETYPFAESRCRRLPAGRSLRRAASAFWKLIRSQATS